MADVPTITSAKPLWPIRRDGKNPENKHREEGDDEDDKGKHDDAQTGDKRPAPTKSDPDGHIDEYV